MEEKELNQIEMFVNLGVDIAHFEDSYYYQNVIEFLNGESDSCVSYYQLRNLYEKYEYKLVNDILLRRYKMKKGAKNE